MRAGWWEEVLGAGEDLELCGGASAGPLSAAQAALQARFPDDLRRLYLASDGVFDRQGQGFVIWPLADVVARNRLAWSLEGPGRQGLVGFGDDGTGAPFCVRRNGADDVLAWSPVSGEATPLAASVTAFWSAWTVSTLPPH